MIYVGIILLAIVALLCWESEQVARPVEVGLDVAVSTATNGMAGTNDTGDARLGASSVGLVWVRPLCDPSLDLLAGDAQMFGPPRPRPLTREARSVGEGRHGAGLVPLVELDGRQHPAEVVTAAAAVEALGQHASLTVPAQLRAAARLTLARLPLQRIEHPASHAGPSGGGDDVGATVTVGGPEPADPAHPTANLCPASADRSTRALTIRASDSGSPILRTA